MIVRTNFFCVVMSSKMVDDLFYNYQITTTLYRKAIR